MFSLKFLPSVSSFKSAIDTLISIAICLSRDLKFRLTLQASFHLVECVVLLQRNVLQLLPCRVVGWDSKGRGGDPSPPLSLAGQGGSEGLLTARHPFEYSSLHFCKLIIKSEILKHYQYAMLSSCG